MARSRLLVSHLMELATIQGSGAPEHLAKIYDWKHDHTVGVARALAGLGTAVLVAVLVPTIFHDPTAKVDWGWLALASVAGVVLVGVGVLVYALARRLQVEYVAAQTLLAELIEVRSFLKLYQDLSSR